MSSQRARARQAIATIGGALAGQSPPVMIASGTVTALYPLEAGIALRPTLDVDCVVDLAGTAEYYAFVERLRTLGFRECTDENAPLCRRVYAGIRVDIVATSATGIGPTNLWYRDAFAAAVVHSLEGDIEVRAITPINRSRRALSRNVRCPAWLLSPAKVATRAVAPSPTLDHAYIERWVRDLDLAGDWAPAKTTET